MTDRFTYRLTVEDYAALINAIGLRRRFGQPPRWLWYTLGVVSASFFVIGAVLGRDIWSTVFFGAVPVFAFAAPSLYWLMLRRAFRKQRLGEGDVVLSFGKSSLHMEQRGISSDIDYNEIRNVDERPDHILIWLNGVQAVIIPKRGLAGMSAKNFIEMVEQYRRDKKQ
jgi:hypothetical protein